MATEYVILIAFAALVVGLIVNLKKQDKDAQTLEERWFANCFEPQFYEQRDPTQEAAQSARAECENAKKMIREMGNKYISEKDIHLLLWRTSGNSNVTFAGWQAQAQADRLKIKQDWIKDKQERVSPEDMARVVWGNNEPENQN